MSSRVLDQVVALVDAARALVGCDWESLDAAEAVEVTAAIATLRGLADAALLHAVERLEATGGAEALGWAGSKEFLTAVTGGNRGEGGGLVKACEQISALPVVREALDAGAVTLPQARAIASEAFGVPRHSGLRDGVAAGLVELAVANGLNASDVRGATKGVLRSLDPYGELIADERGRARGERNAHHQRYLTVVLDDRGGGSIKGYGAVEDIAAIRQVLLAHAAPVTSKPGACGGDPLTRNAGTCPTPGCAHDGRDPRDSPARMFDALVETARVAAASPMTPKDHGARPVIMVTADAEVLRSKIADAELTVPLDHGRLPFEARTPDAELLDGTSVSAHLLRRLACDADILPAVLGADGAVLDVGRVYRSVTAAIWLALILRDKHCAFPGCTRAPQMGDAHHVEHWADGGVTSLDNLASRKDTQQLVREVASEH